MGPIDFSKFDKVRDDYLSRFEFSAIVKSLQELKNGEGKRDEYLDLLGDEENLKKIVGAKPEEIKVWKEQFEAIIDFNKTTCEERVKNKDVKKDCEVCKSCTSNIENGKLSEAIIKSLGYEVEGKKNLRIEYPKIGVKACYICNSQYTIAVSEEEYDDTGSDSNLESRQSRNIAKFQFEHYLPKSIYPCFSISLYNLFPVCSSCNSIKGDRDIGIDFYDEDGLTDAFKFRLVDKTINDFLLKGGDLKIDFIDDYPYPDGTKNISDRFDIKGIYNTQIDQIEELIHRKLKYSESYKNTLSSTFPNLFKNTTLDERILLGTYGKEAGIHERPMSKFIQDIDEQLEAYFKNKLKENIKKWNQL